MKYSKKIYISTGLIIIGVILNVFYYKGMIEQFWSGMGTGLIAAGILQCIKQIKYRTNKEFREQLDTVSNDERIKYISCKAWAWAGYIFVIMAAAATIILKMIGCDETAVAASFCVCILLLLYIAAFMVLKRKY